MFETKSFFEIKSSSEKTFGIFFAILFLLYSLYPLLYKEKIIIWSLITSIIFIIASHKFTFIFILPNKLWLKLGSILGLIISPIVFFLIYAITFYPIGFILKFMNKDLLSLRINKKNDSYWIKRNTKMQSLRKMY